MRKERMMLAAIAAMFCVTSAVQAAVVAEDEFAATLGGLSVGIANDDILEGHPGFNEGVDTFGLVESYNVTTGTTTYYDACLFGTYLCTDYSPLSCNHWTGFHYGTPLADLSDLTDGIPGAATEAVLRDQGFAAAIFRYDLAEPTDVGEIAVIAANTQNKDGRIFQTYIVEVSTDNMASWITLGDVVSTGVWGLSSNDGEYEATRTRVYDDESETLMAGVTNIRFIFYCVSNTQGFYIDPWRGSAQDPEVLNCGLPDHELDTDGFRGAFEASIIKEIDVFAPGTIEPPFVCTNETPFDADLDGDVDQDDFGVFQACFTGTGDPDGIFATLSDACKCMDVSGAIIGEADDAISQDDFGVFQACATGPAPGTLVDASCDNVVAP